MFYVYLIQSLSEPDQRYTGFTADLKTRLKKHNEGASIHTAKYKPWELAAYFAFRSDRRARVRALSENRIGQGVREQAAVVNGWSFCSDPECSPSDANCSILRGRRIVRHSLIS